jgi:demethylmenaquinone methyltransferase/2-methoxy-6-polyprenyl-1,4-benzoquinol methylase
MALNRQKIQDLYRKRAERYDLTANLYYLIGFREWHYRQRAVDALQLKEGDVVVELGCGTGLNFPLLQRIIGPEGRIIGVDLTDRMLEQANKRVSRHGWNNVELVLADAAAFAFPAGVNGILSTFALTLIPGFDRIIRTGSASLAPGGRFVILDLKKPENAPLWLTSLMVRLTAPFGVSLDLADRHPWESVKEYCPVTFCEEFFFGFVYLSVGEVG